ncbi:protein FAR1-RELATED SEQUENCE 6-like [Spinacia oleracea]|uniref:Protein FAR1-RELATED SEQUENCE 6-like n=1 Tax=Spinacia oleracea TaxID=3562 RepID=A0ABM3R8M3_SPIOL|nr:protein FAR1-RELATED SEQUENCE 6-like [Spinacia oleracea]
MVIKHCDLSHNHDLYPDHTRLMANYRCIDEQSFQKMVLNDATGISLNKSFNSLVIGSGRHANVSYNHRDLRNAVNLERRRTIFGGDAAAVEAHFKKMHEFNKDFYSAIQTDQEGKLLNVCWADARCMAQYKDFGDIITFDTTFLCNRYKMPFAPFIGCNHHGSSTVLGAALITHEDAESFVWVLEQWLQCMGKPPMGIITGQCKPIGKAVQTAFPGVPHRLCVWHIMQNASRNLGKYSSWKEIDKDFQVVVHDTLTIEEFEDAWKSMVTKFGLQIDKWINETYRIRASWAPGYWRSSFWAGMSSSQRSEGMNRFFKTYVGLNTCLVQFMKQFEAALRGKVEEEKKLYLDSQNKPYTYNNTPIAEVVFCKAYTNTKFKEVRGEVMGLTHTNIVSTGRDGTKFLYDAVEKIPIPIHKAKQKTFQVTIDKEMGVHIIRAIHSEDVNSIPDKYILTRWRKNVVRDYESIKVEYYEPNDSTQVKNSREVAKRNNYISTLALHNSETLSIFMEATEKMRESLEDTIGIKTTDGDDFMDWWDPSSKRVFGRRRLRPKENNKQHLERSAVPVEGASKDPTDQRGKGRAQEKRKKHPAEKRTRKRRKNVVHDTDEDMDEESDEALPNGEQGHVDAGRSAGGTDSYYVAATSLALSQQQAIATAIVVHTRASNGSRCSGHTHEQQQPLQQFRAAVFVPVQQPRGLSNMCLGSSNIRAYISAISLQYYTPTAARKATETAHKCAQTAAIAAVLVRTNSLVQALQQPLLSSFSRALLAPLIVAVHKHRIAYTTLNITRNNSSNRTNTAATRASTWLLLFELRCCSLEYLDSSLVATQQQQ